MRDSTAPWLALHSNFKAATAICAQWLHAVPSGWPRGEEQAGKRKGWTCSPLRQSGSLAGLAGAHAVSIQYRLPAAASPAGVCASSERYSLFEIPLWAAADAHGRPIASMDPPGNAYEIYRREVRADQGRQRGEQRVAGRTWEAGGACKERCWRRLHHLRQTGLMSSLSPPSTHAALSPLAWAPAAPSTSLQLGWRLGGNRAPLGLFFHAGKCLPSANRL